MGNYSEYLKQKAKKEAREERDLEFLEHLEAHHYSDSQIMELLGFDIEKLKYLRKML